MHTVFEYQSISGYFGNINCSCFLEITILTGKNDINKELWIENLAQLYGEKEEEGDRERNNEGDSDKVQISEKELTTRIKQLKDRNAPSTDRKYTINLYHTEEEH